MAILGATIVCVDINKATNDSMLSELEHYLPRKVVSSKVFTFTCDVTSHTEIIKLANNVKNEIGEVTMLFHCCGIPSPRSLLTEAPRNLSKTFDLAIMSQFWVIY